MELCWTFPASHPNDCYELAMSWGYPHFGINPYSFECCLLAATYGDTTDGDVWRFGRIWQWENRITIPMVPMKPEMVILGIFGWPRFPTQRDLRNSVPKFVWEFIQESMEKCSSKMRLKGHKATIKETLRTVPSAQAVCTISQPTGPIRASRMSHKFLRFSPTGFDWKSGIAQL